MPANVCSNLLRQIQLDTFSSHPTKPNIFDTEFKSCRPESASYSSSAFTRSPSASCSCTVRPASAAITIRSQVQWSFGGLEAFRGDRYHAVYRKLHSAEWRGIVK